MIYDNSINYLIKELIFPYQCLYTDFKWYLAYSSISDIIYINCRWINEDKSGGNYDITLDINNRSTIQGITEYIQSKLHILSNGPERIQYINDFDDLVNS